MTYEAIYKLADGKSIERHIWKLTRDYSSRKFKSSEYSAKMLTIFLHMAYQLFLTVIVYKYMCVIFSHSTEEYVYVFVFLSVFNVTQIC